MIRDVSQPQAEQFGCNGVETPWNNTGKYAEAEK